MSESKTSTNRLAAAEKQRQALILRRAGRSFDDIARALGYSSASGAYKAVSSGLRRTLQEPADELRTLELARLDRLHTAVWAKAINGDLDAVHATLRVAERRSKLLGLDAPTKLNIDLALVNQVAAELEAAGLKASDVFEALLQELAVERVAHDEAE